MKHKLLSTAAVLLLVLLTWSCTATDDEIVQTPATTGRRPTLTQHHHRPEARIRRGRHHPARREKQPNHPCRANGTRNEVGRGGCGVAECRV